MTDIALSPVGEVLSILSESRRKTLMLQRKDISRSKGILYF
ncbi:MULTISPECIES: hypothetical protein [Desertifilum]|nr:MULTISPECIES: hypothetical protein [Desertifilum]MDA0212547.1 hypothetical protein [Cyanobacteria bacterium FC1]